MKTLLFIHQSAELYGSDKTLLWLIQNLDRKRFKAVVLLPFEGPLREALEMAHAEVHIAPVLKVYRKMFTPANLFRFFKDIQSGLQMVKALHRKHHFSLIYSNTLAVLLGVFAAQKLRIPHLWHVHEIIESPGIFKKAYGKLLALRSTSWVVYNSEATGHFWTKTAPVRPKSQVIPNGLPLPKPVSESQRDRVRETAFKATPTDLVFALVGRISRWKGQLLALEAFVGIAQQYPHTRLVFIGSAPPNQEHFEENLHAEINRLGIQHQVVHLPFQEDIQSYWASIDVALVPSTEPEPFGLVAVEAMLAGKPVIGAHHGGLTEIVDHEATGFLVKPGDVTSLREAMTFFITHREAAARMGENGKARARTHFSVQSYTRAFETLFERF